MLLDLHQLIQKHQMHITGVIHIGAHHGEEMQEYDRIDSIQHVIMFEASKHNFDILEDKMKYYPRALCVNKALGAQSESRTFFVETANNGQSNSFLKPAKHLQFYPGITFDHQETIQVEPLDKFECSPILNFINIDVQGFELEVFKGATKTLANVDYIMTEVNQDELYEGCVQIDQLDKFLGQFGFNRVETFFVPNVGWGDALYIKN